MAEEVQKSLQECAMLIVTNFQLSITRPVIQATNFEIKPGTIQMVQNYVQFGELPNDDSNDHLMNFLEICDTFRYNGVSEDANRLRLFPFTLRDKAKSWLRSLPTGSIATWTDLAQKFLAKFFPPAKTARLRNDITSFTQHDSESLYEVWERFKDLLRKCHHYGIPQWLQVQTFYNGLFNSTRTSIDVTTGGAFMGKNIVDAQELLETMAANNYQWPTERRVQQKVAGNLEFYTISILTAQIATLTKKLETLGVLTVQNVSVVCELCDGNHPSEQYAISAESVQFVGNYNRQQNGINPNSYNFGWRNHPNFSWSNNNNQNQYVAPKKQYPLGFQNQTQPYQVTHQPPPQQEKKPSPEELLTRSIAQHDVLIQNLEHQMGQTTNALNIRPPGTLPSDTEVNSKNQGKKHCKAVTLRSGKELSVVVEEVPLKTIDEDGNIENEERKKKEQEMNEEKPVSKPEGGKQLIRCLTG